MTGELTTTSNGEANSGTAGTGVTDPTANTMMSGINQLMGMLNQLINMATQLLFSPIGLLILGIFIYKRYFA